AVAGPQLDRGTVGRLSAGDVQAQPRLDPGDGAVGIDVPLLVATAVAVPDLDFRPGCRLVVERVQALSEDLQLLSADRPPLVHRAAAVPYVQLGTVGRAGGGVVQARSEEHTYELQSLYDLVLRLL